MQAVLWDMDGTLVDSEKLWDISLAALYAELGGELRPEVRASMVGGSAENTIRTVYADLGLTPDPRAMAESGRWLHNFTAQLFDGGLPWCDRARVVSSDANGVTAEVGISFSGIRQTFTTRNEHIPGRAVSMKLVNGPFSRLDGEWNFVPLGDGTQRACKVELTLHYGFDNATLGKLVGPVFDKIAGSLVDAFVKRAGQVYGE